LKSSTVLCDSKKLALGVISVPGIGDCGDDFGLRRAGFNDVVSTRIVSCHCTTLDDLPFIGELLSSSGSVSSSKIPGCMSNSTISSEVVESEARLAASCRPRGCRELATCCDFFLVLSRITALICSSVSPEGDEPLIYIELMAVTILFDPIDLRPTVRFGVVAAEVSGVTPELALR
jgi:hypothetical protein